MLVDQPTYDAPPAPIISGCDKTQAEEIRKLSEMLSAKFEELTLIREFAEQLDLAEDTASICETLLSELELCIRSESLSIELFEDEQIGRAAECYHTGISIELETRKRFIVAANDKSPNQACIPNEQRTVIANHLRVGDHLVNIIVVPIHRHGQQLGQMVALRCGRHQEFGTIESGLMQSTSMMLGVHLINQRQYAELQQMFEGMLRSLVSALDAKDAYTCGHSTRVADLAAELASRLGYDVEAQERIRTAGMLHDVGKIGIEDSVLCKPGKLTFDEYEKIKQHPVIGYEILKAIRPFRKFLPAVRHHHESWDGSGYPDGLKGDQIPRDAQLLAVADAFDAMTSNRPYRDCMPIEKVIRIFTEGRGKQWASDVVDQLLLLPEIAGHSKQTLAELS